MWLRLLNGCRGRAVHTRVGRVCRGDRSPEDPWEEADMKQIVLVVVGLVAALAGLVWTLQGLGYVGGSFMSGATVWAIIGPIVALVGLVLITLGLRRRRRVR